MRKLIIDGSVTSGFQRTAMLGFNGELKTSFGIVEINGVNLEEDSCRTISKEHSHTIFALDRQGMPLIEITTGPQIRKPEQAFEVAKQLGNILRSFKETKRGLGTIRQDLNVSITNGARIEIKGAQNLKMLPEILTNEVKRQIIHLSIIEELKERKCRNCGQTVRKRSHHCNGARKKIRFKTQKYKKRKKAIIKKNGSRYNIFSVLKF